PPMSVMFDFSLLAGEKPAFASQGYFLNFFQINQDARLESIAPDSWKYPLAWEEKPATDPTIEGPAFKLSGFFTWFIPRTITSLHQDATKNYPYHDDLTLRDLMFELRAHIVKLINYLSAKDQDILEICKRMINAKGQQLSEADVEVMADLIARKICYELVLLCEVDEE
nr:hypothetical protein [Pseudomonadota bacterium]